MYTNIQQINLNQLKNELIENPINRSINNCYGAIAKQYNVSTEKVRQVNRGLIRAGLVPDRFGLDKIVANPTHKVLSEYKEIRKPNGDVEITDTVDRKLSDDELYDRYGRNKNEWKISMVWFKDNQDGFRLSVCFIPLKKNQEIFNYQQQFKNFIKDLKPLPYKEIKIKEEVTKANSCLIIPNQDKHLNKFDTSGENDITKRFARLTDINYELVHKAKVHNNLEKIIYIVGSDEFNSEWSNATTKGTPQQNILTYDESFKKICEHEIENIKMLAEHTNDLEIVFLPGNHDFYVGWHLAHFLESYFDKYENIFVDINITNTKILKYRKNLMLFNHGDEMKFKDLASKFPVLAHSLWSFANNYYIFTGDKHFETSNDINGIKCYQVPQLSNAKSNWDDKKGYLNDTAEMHYFVLDDRDGLTDTYRRKI